MVATLIILAVLGLAGLLGLFLFTPVGSVITNGITNPGTYIPQTQEIPYGADTIDKVYSTDSPIENWLHKGIDWIGEAVKSWLVPNAQPSQQDQTQQTVDSGTNLLHMLANLWTGLHEFLVKLLFSLFGQDIQVDRGLVAIVTGIITFIGIVWFGKRILKEWKWIVAVVLGIIVVILIYGVNPKF